MAQDVPPEPPVPDETEQGILEGGGPVVLEEVVPYPGEGVALDERDCNEPPVLGDHGADEQHGGYGRADEVQTAADGITVLAEIERIEVGKSAIGLHVAVAHDCKIHRGRQKRNRPGSLADLRNHDFVPEAPCSTHGARETSTQSGLAIVRLRRVEHDLTVPHRDLLTWIMVHVYLVTLAIQHVHDFVTGRLFV